MTNEKLTYEQFSSKGRELIDSYTKMADGGYQGRDGNFVENAFSDFELRPFRKLIKDTIDKYQATTVLDYGCGGADWSQNGFDQETGRSAIDYFGISQVNLYEPARDIDQREMSDCVVSFDVLEHIFISDVPNVIRDMLRFAKKIAIINVACYPANALLPNGENAHITVRHPIWWKGMFDAIAPEFPNVDIFLCCSESYGKLGKFEIFSDAARQGSTLFVNNS